jgi:hypothetical protein
MQGCRAGKNKFNGLNGFSVRTMVEDKCTGTRQYLPEAAVTSQSPLMEAADNHHDSDACDMPEELHNCDMTLSIYYIRIYYIIFNTSISVCLSCYFLKFNKNGMKQNLTETQKHEPCVNSAPSTVRRAGQCGVNCSRRGSALRDCALLRCWAAEN